MKTSIILEVKANGATIYSGEYTSRAEALEATKTLDCLKERKLHCVKYFFKNTNTYIAKTYYDEPRGLNVGQMSIKQKQSVGSDTVIKFFTFEDEEGFRDLFKGKIPEYIPDAKLNQIRLYHDNSTIAIISDEKEVQKADPRTKREYSSANIIEVDGKRYYICLVPVEDEEAQKQEERTAWLDPRDFHAEKAGATN